MGIKRWLAWSARLLTHLGMPYTGKTYRRGLFGKPELEGLERRILPSTVTWINPSGGSWDVGSNWSTGQAPGAGDVAVINTTSAATIAIQASDAISVQGLTTGSNDTLSITGGLLLVTSGNSTLSGGLSMTGGSLAASGSGVNLSVNGSTTLSGANLSATGGATLTLPQVTGSTASGDTFQAEGVGSVLTVAAPSNLAQQGPWSVNADSGGTVNLSGLTSLNGTSGITISDTNGSTINLLGQSSNSNTSNSTSVAGELTSLQGINMMLDGIGGSGVTIARLAGTAPNNGSFGITARANPMTGNLGSDPYLSLSTPTTTVVAGAPFSITVSRPQFGRHLGHRLYRRGSTAIRAYRKPPSRHQPWLTTHLHGCGRWQGQWQLHLHRPHS